MKRCLSAILAAMAFVGALYAQSPPRILAQTDIDRFVKDFPGIVRDLDSRGANFDKDVAKAQEHPATFTPSALRSMLRIAAAKPEVRAILEKYSWNDRFWDVYYVVFIGVYVSMMDQALAQYPSPELTSLVDKFRAAVYKDDHTLVLRNLDALLAAFDADAGGE